MTGQVDPFECNALSSCPEGSSKANKTGTVVLLIIVILLIYGAFLIRYAVQKRKREIQEKLIRQELSGGRHGHGHDSTQDGGKKTMESFEVSFDGEGNHNGLKENLMDDHIPFHIRFENLGLKLKTGTRIMEGVHGQFLPGRMCAVMGSSGECRARCGPIAPTA